MGTTANAVTAAASAAAAAAAAQRAAAYTAAMDGQSAATDALAKATRAYDAAKADHDAALALADLVHVLRKKADATLDASRRVLAGLVRSMMQQPSAPGADADVVFSGGGGSLLDRLGTLHTLSRLTAHLDDVRIRVATDTKRAQELRKQDAAAQSAVNAIPLGAVLTAVDAATATNDAAAAKLAALSAATDIATELASLPGALLSLNTDGLSAQGWAKPAFGPITDVFGPRLVHPVTGLPEFHQGTDIGASCHAAIYAAAAGVVASAGPFYGYGNWILINHGDGIQTGYGHIADGATLVAAGDHVDAGQVIAGVGSTGESTGCHLHFEVRVNGTAIDPQPFLALRGVTLG